MDIHLLDTGTLILIALVFALAVALGMVVYRYRRDMERHRRTEQQLRESEQEYRNLFGYAQRQMQELALIEKVRAALAGELELRTLVRNAVEAIVETFGYARVSIYLIQNNALVLQHQAGYETIPEKMPLDRGIMGRAIRSGQPILLADMRSDPSFLETPDDVVADVCVPLFDHKQAVGALNVESAAGVTLSEADLTIMAALGAHINMVIERARLHSLVREREAEQRKISKLEIIAPLAGGLAHDFNNLLTGILGNITFAKLFLKPDDDDRLGVSLKRAEDAAMQARNLTHQLLTFAKEGTLVTQPVSIQELIRESASFVLHGSNARCEFAIPDTLWPADIDIGQISQVIQNLVLNAQQAMPEGGVITVRAENVLIQDKTDLNLPHGTYVKISVADEGVGIPEEIRDKIFDPYFTTKPSGSGLGLATAYSIIANHRGALTLESVVGEGSIFTIYLPASPEEEEVVVEDKAPEYHTGEGRILIMDADDTVQRLVSGILTHCGYTVTVTRDGTEAVDRYVEARKAGQPFDAVLMDLTVPGGMGGREAAKYILKHDPAAKIIISSGYPDDPVLVNYREYGFVGMMIKPYRAQELSAALHEVITNGYVDSSRRG